MKFESRNIQIKVCGDMGAEVCDVFAGDKVGISQSALDGKMPLNGMRCKLDDGGTGWFLWGGEVFSEDADFFKPYHAGHLPLKCPLAIRFLLLPQGWRFITDGSYEDIWFDPNI